MEEQIAFFNNANQIIFDYALLYRDYTLQNYLKDIHFDKLNDIKNIVLNYTDNVNNLNLELNNFEEFIIVVDKVTYNKLNVTKFNNY